jgi:hypothetical protein
MIGTKHPSEKLNEITDCWLLYISEASVRFARFVHSKAITMAKMKKRTSNPSSVYNTTVREGAWEQYPQNDGLGREHADALVASLAGVL